MSGLSMTEHGSIDSHSALERAAVKAGIKPLFGVEGYFPAEPKLAGEVQSKFHLTIIARNAEGYRNLVQLVTKSWQNFYYEPTMTWEMLKQHKRGLLILSGCLGSYLACATVGGKTIDPKDASFKRGLGIARAFKREFGRWYHIEVQAFPELDKTRQFNPLAARIAKTIGAKLVGTMDCHYTILEEAEVQQILHGLRPGNKQSLEERARTWGYEVPLCPPPSDMAIYRRLRATGLTKGQAIEAVASTAELASECVVELPKLPGVYYPGLETDFDSWGDHDVSTGHCQAETHFLSAGGDMMAVWNHWLREGWRFRGLDKLPPTERRKYQKQLIYEKELIESKEFVHYFLLVSAGVRHIKDLGHPVGPGRGSAAASLVAWVLRVTEVNPLRPEFNGMIRFERFIDETRTDLPDIDLDFPGSTRTVLRDFYVRLLGKGCVNNVGTYTYFRSKNSLDDVARVYHIPKFEVDTVKSYLIERTNVDLRASNTIADTVAQFPVAAEVFERHPELHKAELLEGGIRGFGIHAAAIILSNGPISKITSVAEREVPKGSGNIVQAIGLDKKDAEYRGLLKMDFLGLNTMQMLDDCIHHPEVAMTLNELYALPLDDEKIYEAFRRNDVVGIFQMNGRATRYVNGAVQPTTFQHLMDVTSLSRPGALHGGGTQEYIDIKNGVKEHEALHPAIEELTSLTQYQIVYQEQILTILREIGEFPWGVVNAIRTIISKKHGEAAFNAKRQEFLDGASRLHKRRTDMPPMSERVADILWRRMITAGAYCVTEDTLLTRGSSNHHGDRDISVGDLYRLIHGPLEADHSDSGNNAPLKISDRDVDEIRSLYSEGNITTRSLAKKYEVSPALISMIINHKRRSERKPKRAHIKNCVVCGCRRKKQANGKYPARGLCGTCSSWYGQWIIRGLKVLQLDSDGQIRPGNIKDIWESGLQDVYEVKTENHSIKASDGHRFLTTRGYRKLKQLKVGDMLVVNGGQEPPRHSPTIRPSRAIRELVISRAGGVCEDCGSNRHLELAHIKTLAQCGYDKGRYNRPSNILLLCNSHHKIFDYENGSRKKRFSRGLSTLTEPILSITHFGREMTYDVEMDTPGHNFVANGIVVHNSFNVAHAASYSLISYYCQHMKVYHPHVFYYASLKNMGDDETTNLIRDAHQHKIDVHPPSLRRSGTSWEAVRGSVRAGYEQIPGIGPKMAPAIVQARRVARPAWRRWDDLLQVKGVGAKGIEKIKAWTAKDDPWDVYKLERDVAAVKKCIISGELGPLPEPTHSSAEIPEDKGVDLPVVWLGQVTQRNWRDMFEYHMSKFGEELDPESIKDPELREWVVCFGEDGTERILIKIDRWKYPRLKGAISAMDIKRDLILVEGFKSKYSSARQINARNVYVIDPET